MARPLPLLLLPLAAPADVIFEVCMSSPMYLGSVRPNSVTVGGDSRLKELIPSLELFVFGLDNFDAIHNLQQACLECFRLPGEGCQSGGPGGALVGGKQVRLVE